MVWKPTEGFSFRVVDIFNTENALRSHFYHKELSIETVPESAVFVNELDPDTEYKFITTEHTSSEHYRTQLCPRRQTTFFTTRKGNCGSVCQKDDTLFSADIKGEFYDPYLRLLPLPDHSANMITWSTYNDYVSNASYFYVIKILGEPFLSHLHSYFIPIGQTYHVISDLDPDKPYSISLVVFDTANQLPLFTSEYLIVMPTKDMPISSSKQDDIKTKSKRHAVSSMDLYRSTANISDEEVAMLTTTEDIVLQQIDELNSTLISKAYPEDKFHFFETLTPQNDTVKPIEFLLQEEPEVYTIENITAREGEMVDITCLSRGDPYPIITWINLATNESMSNVNSSKRVFTTLSKYVGSTKTMDLRAFLGVKSFLTFQNITLFDSGQYACAAENTAGIDMRMFQVVILPEAPGPVQNLICSAPNPFEIRVTWLPPHQSHDRKSKSPVTGYRLALLDEYDVMMAENNSTDTHSVFTMLQPNTVYRVLVSAYHKYGEGTQQKSETKTRRIPILGPAENVTVVTLNSTIVHINWEHPIAVSTNQIRLRNYIIHLRKDGDRKSEERLNDRNITEVTFRGLTAEQQYELRIIGMSEDGQVSYSEWMKASTYREAYMEETRPPPPPYNVYLRPEGGNIIVSWLPPRNDDNIIVRGYAITVLNNGTKRESMEVGYEESSVIIYEVDMGIIYQISVQTTNQAGLSVEQWAELYIPEIRVTDQPVENFRGRGVSSTNVQLQWDPPGDGTYSHFHLAYINADGELASLPGGGILPGHVRSYIVRSLTPFTEYLFTVTPYFKRMKGIPTNITMKTLSDRPANAPENVTLKSYNSTAILIEGLPPSTGKNGVILTYKVSYRTKRTWRNDVIYPAEDDEILNSYVTGLLPSTTYEFRVRALTVNGSGPWSHWQQIRTRSPDPIIPKVPRNLMSNSTQTFIKVSWDPPDQDIGHITGYVVGYGKFIPEVYRASVTKETNWYIIDNLVPGSMYIISIRSFNEYGESVAIFDVISTQGEK